MATCKKPVWFKNALVSVSDKTGLVDFIGPLVKKGMRVVSTGGTAEVLKQGGISALELSQQTGFNEVMGGRVKSLHPRIYMPLLARLNHIEDQKILKKEGLSLFDLVVCNLYPFSEKKATGESNLEEWIDVGGPTLLRASAKNFERITVVCDPSDYQWILQESPLSINKRRALAGKAFSLLAEYNKQIAHWLLKPPVEHNHVCTTSAGNLSTVAGETQACGKENHKGLSVLMEEGLTGQDLHIKARFFKSLRYGENPHQKAVWFQVENTGLHLANQLQGKALSFNNISDLHSAASLLKELDGPSAVAVKHNNACGVACDSNMERALNKALKADPVSVFGGIVALNKKVSEESAKLLCALFLEAVIAPDYSDSALELFKSKKKNLRILKWSVLSEKRESSVGFSLRSVAGGLIMQEQKAIQGMSQWQFMKAKPSLAVQSDLQLAWKVAAHLKSNAIALVSKNQTVGLGIGQVNRVSAVEMAIKSYQHFHPQAEELVMASDGFFPFPDSIELAGKAGIKWIVQPGGSLRDKEVMAKAKQLSINMICTGQRCFAH